MKSLAPRVLVAAAALVAALSCGDVPTLDGGIAYISPIILPAPAVATLDSLRDSLGRAAPLQVLAFDRNDAVIPNVPVRYVITSLPAGVVIDSNGFVSGFDSVRSVQIVARIGTRLQTTPATLLVVPQPDSIIATGAIDSLLSFTKSSALQVRVSGLRKGTRVPVDGIIVHYQITKIDNSTVVDTGGNTLVDDAGFPQRPDARRSVDTTLSGVASRFLLPVSLTGVQTITVEARATSLKGAPLTGSPVVFVVPVKKGP
jgi:hypothetical protein